MPLDTDSFSVKLRTTKRQRFGLAVCNVTVEPNLTLRVGTEDVDPDATYEISGDGSDPVIETAELTTQTSLNYKPSMINTASASTKVSIEHRRPQAVRSRYRERMMRACPGPAANVARSGARCVILGACQPLSGRPVKPRR
ncbi:hypothetical protein [Streptomyces sp. NPDC002769]|uniref:hypothetical protein n=1 Tax=Streptomyces sp. NPDC002769 TaxID=3154542 RepID=UPI00331F352E